MGEVTFVPTILSPPTARERKGMRAEGKVERTPSSIQSDSINYSSIGTGTMFPRNGTGIRI